MCVVTQADFDQWEEQGASGWNYQNCLPYFKKFENHQCRDTDYTGNEGPVAISDGNNMRNPLYRAFIDAGVEAGYGETLKTTTVIVRRASGKSL